MTATTPTSLSSEQLAIRILAALEMKPNQKGSDLAKLIDAERKDVNHCLARTLAGKVVQDSTYRWALRKDYGGGTTSDGGSSTPQTEISRLCRYYLESIGQDSGEGVSVFAASKFGDPDYAELSALPMAGTDWDWWNSPGVERVLSKVKADRSNLLAWLGYPVRLREHRTARWQGYFVEPVLLWAIELPERPGDPYRFVDELPVPNFSVLRSMAMGDASAVVEEAARLDEELGLNSPLEDRPEVDELIERLVTIRPDWDWQEAIQPENCSRGVPLAVINKAGIYNRAVIIPGKRSPYTQGLESELKKLGETAESEVANTALGRWLSGSVETASEASDQPLIEVLPMNSEQRAAVISALAAQHTVVTGPPGTGKSQVVTNLLINAAWRGMKVLFASKNNKAVDVVEARVNGLGNRPVLLRLGSKEYQAKLSSYLTTMLSGQIGEDDRISYEEGLARHKRLSAKSQELDRLLKQTLEARNHVDRIESEVETLRELFAPDRFNTLDANLVSVTTGSLQQAGLATDAVDADKQGFFGKLVLKFALAGRVAILRELLARIGPTVEHLKLAPIAVAGQPNVSEIRLSLKHLGERQDAAQKVLAYQNALEVLRSSPAFEEISKQRQDLNRLIAENSTRLWKDWVQLAPSRLTAAQRKDIADYAALLQVMTGPDAQSVNSSVKAKARSLQASVSSMFSCWAVTSLSARGKVPFEPAHFDLVVIDEASQCDIASALPLLFRAKRSVIIGDPMQLRHISSVSKSKDSDLQTKYGLVENRASWLYSVNSLYDVAAAVADPAQIINLRDHHRSHSDIIEFSNRMFYGGKLRVATRYAQLKRPNNNAPGVIWQDVKGEAIRPGSSGAQNPIEAKAVVEALEDLLVLRGYQGSVGVVTPFRAQVQLIQTLISQHPKLSDAGNKAELLVDTVHRFQGDERDVIFFSPVVAGGIQPGALGFLRSNGNLFNVAITRARGLLHIVGDKAAAGTCGVDYLEEFAAYVSQLGTASAGPFENTNMPMGAEYPAVARPERVSDWEREFYRALYSAGVRPIPQYTIEQYDLDFAVIVGDRKLNIEVDGERYHRSWTGELCLRDQLRNQRLIELGWEVKRFWVYEIRDRLPACVQIVRNWVASGRTSHGPPVSIPPSS